MSRYDTPFMLTRYALRVSLSTKALDRILSFMHSSVLAAGTQDAVVGVDQTADDTALSWLLTPLSHYFNDSLCAIAVFDMVIQN